MSEWIFLSKEAEDSYINLFAQGCQQTPTDTETFDYNLSDSPIVLRGILKHKIMKRCWQDKRTFYYMDTGYFGNEKTPINPNGWKFWHRIVKDDLQHGEIIKRPDDRWKKFNKKINPWKKTGRKILIAKPDVKPCKFYDIDLDSWTKDVIDTIKKNTDRPIVIRERAAKRQQRISIDTLESALMDDVFALVTFNSVAATESVFLGIPAFSLAPCNAASPVSSKKLEDIEHPYYPDDDLRHDWACHLAYGQFHISELKDGSAKRKLETWYG
jgi:hypothetical protein